MRKMRLREWFAQVPQLIGSGESHRRRFWWKPVPFLWHHSASLWPLWENTGRVSLGNPFLNWGHFSSAVGPTLERRRWSWVKHVRFYTLAVSPKVQVTDLENRFFIYCLLIGRDCSDCIWHHRTPLLTWGTWWWTFSELSLSCIVRDTGCSCCFNFWPKDILVCQVSDLMTTLQLYHKAKKTKKE